jgi:hypothetical protein
VKPREQGERRDDSAAGRSVFRSARRPSMGGRAVIMLRDAASAVGVLQLRQLVTLLQRARAASLRLEARALDSSAAPAVG